MIQKKTGYANYYFNQVNQQRVWSSFVESSGGTTLPDTWTLRGTMADGSPFEITLDKREVSGLFPTSRDRVDPRVDFDQQLLPVGSGGLLPALSLWQRMLQLGPEQFGETYYLGTTPLIDHQGLFDVLVGTHNVVECWFAFDPQSGNLVGIEMFPDANTDPCETYFSDYRQVGKHQLPHRILVRYGDTIFAELQVQDYVMSADAGSS